MKTRVLGLAVLLAAGFLVGCGDHPNAKAHDDLAQKVITMMNEMSEHMESMTTNPTDANIKNRQDKIKGLADGLEATTKEIEKLPKSEQNRIDRKFKGDIERAEARMKKATRPFEAMLKK